jgi:large subunit ribosomal protein LP0
MADHERRIPENKTKIVDKVRQYFREYSKFLIVNAMNINARQMMKIRHDLRGKGIVMFGKNTLIRRAIADHVAENPKLEALKKYIVNGNGFIFTDGPMSVIKEIIDANCVGSPARTGAIAPCDVIIPPMKTNMSPAQVSVLHALGITSKIFKGTIEIVSEKMLIKEGDKVGASESNLLTILGIQPFRYALKIVQIYDNGNFYTPEILSISDSVLQSKFNAALTRVAGLALGIGYPCAASVPHMVGHAFKDIASIAVSIEYNLRQIADIQALLADPEALAKMKSSQQTAAATANTPAAAEAAPEEPADDEPAMDLGLDDLFG